MKVLTDSSFWGSIMGTGVSGGIAIYIMRNRIRYDEAIRSKEYIESYLKINDELKRELQNAVESLEFYNDACRKKGMNHTDLKMVNESLRGIAERLKKMDIEGVEYEVEVIYSTILNDLEFVLGFENSTFFEIFDMNPNLYEKHIGLYYNQIEKRLKKLSKQLNQYNEEQLKKYKKVNKITDKI